MMPCMLVKAAHSSRWWITAYSVMQNPVSSHQLMLVPPCWRSSLLGSSLALR